MTYDDDILILYYYGDGLDAGERARIDAALRADAALKLRYLELAAALEQLRAPPAVEPPAAAVHRWQTGLARAARLEAAAASRPRFGLRWAWAGTALAAAVLAVALVRQLAVTPPDDVPPMVAQPAPAAPATVAPPLQRGVQAHLRETGRLVEALAGGDTGFGTALAEALERNRAYERSAEEQDADRLARLLRAFEPSLRRLADVDTDPSTFEAERERLAFELGVARSQLAHAPARFL